MTVRTPPLWLQAGAYPAEDDRGLISAVFPGEGVLLPGDLAVTQRGAGANMSVDVAGGRCVVAGDQATYEGSYFMENRGTTNVPLSASDPTNPRIDRIIAEVLNQEYSGVDNLWQLRAMTGTPAGSPSAPALPNNAISLATVAVAAAAASITNANITDLRPRAYGFGSTIICTSSTRPSSPFEGMEIYETDTDKVLIYSGTGWATIAYIGALDTYTPTLVQGASSNIAKTLTYCRYRKLGRVVKVWILLTVTGSGSASAAVTLSLPFTAAQAGNIDVGVGHIFDASASGSYPGRAVLNTTTTVALQPTNVTTGNYLGVTQFTAALANTDSIDLSFEYEATS